MVRFPVYRQLTPFDQGQPFLVRPQLELTNAEWAAVATETAYVQHIGLSKGTIRQG